MLILQDTTPEKYTCEICLHKKELEHGKKEDRTLTYNGSLCPSFFSWSSSGLEGNRRMPVF